MPAPAVALARALMVSRRRPPALLTPGEIMQLPPTDEIVMVAGTPPIRAKKAPDLRGSRFAERILPLKAPPTGRCAQPIWPTIDRRVVRPQLRYGSDAERTGDDPADPRTPASAASPNQPEHERAESRPIEQELLIATTPRDDAAPKAHAPAS